MKLPHIKHAVKFSVDIRLKTPLMLRSGKAGVYTDSSIEKTQDGDLHINGYVWASLMRRALKRLEGADVEKMAASVGFYPALEKKSGKNETADDALSGVSPLWCEASFLKILPEDASPDMVAADIRHGIRIDRKMGAVSTGTLYSDEVLPPGYQVTLNFNYFCDAPEDAETNLFKALWIIEQGIENIGGGWSYGYGRLEILNVKTKRIDMTKAEDRKVLWQYGQIEKWDINTPLKTIQPDPPAIRLAWTRIQGKAIVADGQLMAIKTTIPPLEFEDQVNELPDTFVFRQNRIKSLEQKPEAEIVITGKAIRQALLSVPIERKFRSADETMCPGITRKKKDGEKGCTCKRCRWFGSVDRRGSVSVMDATVQNPETTILHRIQLCEHSMQNMNLFSGEFLCKGEFEINILIDHAHGNKQELLDSVEKILSEINENNAAVPPGWHRIGGTSTCTGQIALGQIKIKNYDSIKPGGKS